MRLDVAIATCREDGILRVVDMNLPRVEGVHYVVSWQLSEGVKLPEALYREDMEVIRTATVGLSNNRNVGVSRCKGDIILFADDDLRYTPEQLRSVITTFETHQDVDFAAFRYDGPDEGFYPSEECSLQPIPKNFQIVSFIIAVKRQSVLRKLYFDNRLGLGAEYAGCGEEDFYLYNAKKRGLNCRFFPITITSHPGQTTGYREIRDIRTLRGCGAIIRIEYPRTSLLRIPLKAWRLLRSGQCRNLLFALRGLMQGWHFGAELLKSDSHE